MEASAVFPLKVLNLLEEADFVWDRYKNAFIKARNPEMETTEKYRSQLKPMISYEDLEKHGLLQSTTETEQELGMQWLRKRLENG